MLELNQNTKQNKIKRSYLGKVQFFTNSAGELKLYGSITNIYYIKWAVCLFNSPGNVPDLDRVETRSRSGTNVPDQVTNSDFCSLVNLFEAGEPFSVVFLKYKIFAKNLSWVFKNLPCGYLLIKTIELMRLCNQLKPILFFNFFPTECDIGNLETSIC